MKKILLLVIGCLFFEWAMAQPGGGGDPGGGEPVPIGGVEFLITAGAILGLKRIVSLSKKRKENL